MTVVQHHQNVTMDVDNISDWDDDSQIIKKAPVLRYKDEKLAKQTLTTIESMVEDLVMKEAAKLIQSI